MQIRLEFVFHKVGYNRDTYIDIVPLEGKTPSEAKFHFMKKYIKLGENSKWK